MKSTTAGIAHYTLALLAMIVLAIVGCAVLLQSEAEALEAAVGALAWVAMAAAGGGGIGAVSHGVRHFGTRAPTSAQLAARGEQ